VVKAAAVAGALAAAVAGFPTVLGWAQAGVHTLERVRARRSARQYARQFQSRRPSLASAGGGFFIAPNADGHGPLKMTGVRY